MIVYSSSTCPKCKVLKMKLDKAGLEYEVVEDVEVMQELGIKSLPYLQLSSGKLLDFVAAIAFAKEMEVAKDEN